MGTRTIAVLDELSEALKGASDYAIAKALGVTRATVSSWRVGRGSMSDDVAIRTAKILKRDPGEFLLIAAEERATTEIAKREWTKLSKQLRSTAAGLAVAVLGFTGFQQAQTMTKADQTVRTVCILC
jgi:plasmid maintenance system antidote protein VapI